TWTLPSFSTSKTFPSSTFAPTSPANFSSRIVCPGATRYCFPPDRITAYIVPSSSIKTNGNYTQNSAEQCRGLRLIRGSVPEFPFTLLWDEPYRIRREGVRATRECISV